MKIKRVKKEEIHFNNDIKCLTFDIKTPILINKRNECVLGNCLRNFKNNIVDVIVTDFECDFEVDALKDFEIDFVDNICIEKKYEIENQINKYLRTFNSQIELTTLFDSDDLYDIRTINEENYYKPCEHNFKNKKKIKEVNNIESLFSFNGDEF